MKKLTLVLLLLTTVVPVFADGMAGPGIEAAYNPGSAVPLVSGINASFLYSTYAFPTSSWSFFLDTGAVFTYWLPLSSFQIRASLSGEASYRRGSNLFALMLDTRIDSIPAAPSFQSENSAGLLFSFGTEPVFQINPLFFFDLGDRQRYGPGGMAGFSFLLSGSSILDAEISSRYLWLPRPSGGFGYSFFVSPSLTLTAYTASFISSITTLSYRRNLSSKTSPAGDYPVQLETENYHRIGLREELSFPLGYSADIGLVLPISFTLKDHNAVSETLLLADREWVFSVEPEFSLRLEPAQSLVLNMSAGVLIPFSNSDYQNNFSAGAAVDLLFRF